MSGTFGPWPGNGDGATQPAGDANTTPNLYGEPTTSNDAAPEIDSGIPFWDEAPDIWDTVTIAGFTFPGVASIGGEPKRKLDKKNAKGVDGRTITDDGADGADVEVVFRIWTKEQWINYQLAIPFIDPNQQKGKIMPVDIVHPALKLHGIKSMYVESMTLPQSCDVPQCKEIRIKATSWAPAPPPAKSKSTTPDESDLGGGKREARKGTGGHTGGNYRNENGTLTWETVTESDALDYSDEEKLTYDPVMEEDGDEVDTDP